jgi:hypothetical protein
MTTPRTSAASRRPEMRNSRATMPTTIHAGKTPWSMSTTSTDKTSSLSATGSSRVPSEDVWPRRRAITPSSQSVVIAAMKIPVAQ